MVILGLAHRAHVRTAALSGGERKRVSIAIGLIGSPGEAAMSHSSLVRVFCYRQSYPSSDCRVFAAHLNGVLIVQPRHANQQ
jgi:hypothetical protein